MHNEDIKNQFVELRARGASVPMVAEKLNIPASTLYDWNYQCRAEIHNLKLLMLEQVEERVLGDHQVQLESLARCLQVVEKQVGHKLPEVAKYLNVKDLIRMAASLRSQLYRFRGHLGVTPPARKSCISTEPTKP